MIPDGGGLSTDMRHLLASKVRPVLDINRFNHILNHIFWVQAYGRQMQNFVWYSRSSYSTTVFVGGLTKFWRRTLQISVHVYCGVARDKTNTVEIVDYWRHLDVSPPVSGKTSLLGRWDPFGRRLRQRQQTLIKIQTSIVEELKNARCAKVMARSDLLAL